MRTMPPALRTAKVLGVAGVLAYNWWVVVPFVPGLMPSVNGFFSDLEATGRPHADLMSDADLVAGVLLLAALLLRGSAARHGVRRGVEMDGGLRGGRRGGGPLSLRLFRGPERHLPHSWNGTCSFRSTTTSTWSRASPSSPRLTIAAVIAMRRTRQRRDPRGPRLLGGGQGSGRGYPLLGLVYLTDRLGTFVEPIFFITFSAMVLAELFEPIGQARWRSSWPRRVSEPERRSRRRPDWPAPAPVRRPTDPGATVRVPARDRARSRTVAAPGRRPNDRFEHRPLCA